MMGRVFVERDKHIVAWRSLPKAFVVADELHENNLGRARSRDQVQERSSSTAIGINGFAGKLTGVGQVAVSKRNDR